MLIKRARLALTRIRFLAVWIALATGLISGAERTICRAGSAHAGARGGPSHLAVGRDIGGGPPRDLSHLNRLGFQAEVQRMITVDGTQLHVLVAVDDQIPLPPGRP
jgi:hypothetical protein